MKEIVIISGKGGTGKTTITASLAALWKNSIIADCDVDAADLHLLMQPSTKQKNPFYSGKVPNVDTDRCNQCGKCLEVCEFNAIRNDFSISKIDCEGCGACAFFCPTGAIQLEDRHCGEWVLSETRFGPMVHARLGIAEANSGRLVSLIRKEAKQLAEKKDLDLILIDGSPGIGCPVISSITGASLVVIVTEPTVSGIHDMERVLGLTNHFQIPSMVIINKADLNQEISQQIESGCKNQNIEVLGRIPYDPIVTEAMVQGIPVIEHHDGSVAHEIRSISHKILNTKRLDEKETDASS